MQETIGEGNTWNETEGEIIDYYDEYYVPNYRETVEQTFYFKTSPLYSFWPSICLTQRIDFANSRWETKLDYRDCTEVAYASTWTFREGEGPLRETDVYTHEDAYNQGYEDGYDEGFYAGETTPQAEPLEEWELEKYISEFPDWVDS